MPDLGRVAAVGPTPSQPDALGFIYIGVQLGLVWVYFYGYQTVGGLKEEHVASSTSPSLCTFCEM